MNASIVGDDLEVVTGVYGHTGDGGPATAAEIGNPSGLAFDAAGNLYFLESAFGYVRRISPDGTITTIAGGGTNGSDGAMARDTRLVLPSDIAIDRTGNIYIAEPVLNRVRKLALGGPVPIIQTGALLPTATVHERYVHQLAASGGTPPYRTWLVGGGRLPKGVTLDASAGVLSGTPAVAGRYTFTVEISDNAGARSEKRFTLVVRPESPRPR